MALLEGKTPAERKKIIAAAIFFPPALLILAYLFGFIGGGSRKPTAQRPSSRDRNVRVNASDAQSAEEIRELLPPRLVSYEPPLLPASDAGRNIFAFSSGSSGTPGTSASRAAAPATPSETVTDIAPAITPTPAPPPPPLMLVALTPSSVFARTGSFMLNVAGDKFTPETKIYLNGVELPTEFVNAQTLRANVSANLIAGEGGRAVVVRTPDSLLYSNVANLNVMPPPAPQVSYVGLLGKRDARKDIAVLKDRKGELHNVLQGDRVGGRFRVVSINENAIELVDTELNIEHTLRFVESSGSRSSYSPPPQVSQPSPPVQAAPDKPLEDDPTP